MKIIVSLSVPVVRFRTDVFVPSKMKAKDLVRLFSESIQEASSKFYPVTGQEVLCHLESGLVLNKEESLENNGVKNGHHLILI